MRRSITEPMMAQAARAPERWTLDEFLAFDDGTDTHYELHDGEIVAMAPPSGAHSMLLGGIDTAIGSKLSRPCRTAPGAGVFPPTRPHTYYEADVVVTCKPVDADGRIVDPVVIVEVLSPSTSAADVLRKLPDYREIVSVQDILLVSSTEQRIEHWRRDADGWIVKDHREGMFELQAFPIAIDVGQLYEGALPVEPAAETERAAP